MSISALHKCWIEVTGNLTFQNSRMNLVLHFIQKPVIFFALQNKFLVSIQYPTLGRNRLNNKTCCKLTLHQSHKLVKQTPTIRRQKTTDCLRVFDHFVRLALKGLRWQPNHTEVNNKNNRTWSNLTMKSTEESHPICFTRMKPSSHYIKTS